VSAKESIKRGPCRVPGDWELEETLGKDPFEDTRAVYRSPENYRHVWESRRNRKGRGHRVISPWPTSRLKKSPWLRFWAPWRLSWWVAVVFTVGSALFTLAAAASLFPVLFGGESAADLVTASSYFAGALLFTGSIYLQVLEGINAADYIDTVKEERLENEFRFFAWEPHRLAFMAPFVLLVGSVFFNVETTIALAEELEWLKAPLIVGLSSVAGAVLFLVASYLQLIEVCHRYLCGRVGEISWWVTTFFVVGSAGFVVGAVFGFGIIGLSSATDALIVKISFLQGSFFFLVGSYLMLPELFSD
jgi:hypothetical protein